MTSPGLPRKGSTYHAHGEDGPVLLAGIGWTDRGWDVACCDATGREAGAPVHFPVGSAAALTTHLRELDARLDHDLVCVVESTNGTVDGGLLAGGVRVHRADPPVLPPRPGSGSVAALDLARAGSARLRELPRLRLEGGSLTDRPDPPARTRRDHQEAVTSLTRAGRCLAHGSREGPEKVVALTFDDGPQPPWTDRVLEALDHYGIPATFFCVGLQASGHRELLARMVESGHGVGNHTWSHPFLPDLSARELQLQLDLTAEALQSWAGPRRLFRPPYGSGTAEQITSVTADPDVTVVLWDVDTNDWTMPGPEAIAATVLDHTQPGSIALMHDGGGDRSQTAAALPRIIEGLLARDYRFVLVEELLIARRAGT